MSVRPRACRRVIFGVCRTIVLQGLYSVERSMLWYLITLYYKPGGQNRNWGTYTSLLLPAWRKNVMTARKKSWLRREKIGVKMQNFISTNNGVGCTCEGWWGSRIGVYSMFFVMFVSGWGEGCIITGIRICPWTFNTLFTVNHSIPFFEGCNHDIVPFCFL